MIKYVTVFWLLLFFSFRSSAQSDTCLQMELGISFPPVSDDTQRDFTAGKLDDLGVKKIRFGEDWALREPVKGDFNWAPLDARIKWATDNGYEILLTIQSNGPDWACTTEQNDVSCVFANTADFQFYIDTLMKRYAGKIDKIQFGNEWQSDYWYIGDAAEFIEANNILYNSVKTYSPSTTVVLGGFTTISLRYLAACNGYVSSFYDGEGNFYDAQYLAEACQSQQLYDSKQRIDSVLKYAKYDMLDIHLYDDVEQWDEYYANFTDTISKPVIVSEFGGPNLNYEPYTDEYQAQRLYQYIKKLDSLGIPEAYFFKLVDGADNPAHAKSGLVYDTDFSPKPSYYVFKSMVACEPVFFEKPKLVFLPNPMDDYTLMQIENVVQGSVKSIFIYRSDGRLVRYTKNVTADYYRIERQGLASGVYFVVVKDGNGTVAKGKLVVK